MKIIGYRIVPTELDWGRRIGDVNGVMPGNVTATSVVLVETDSDLIGMAVGQGGLIDTVFPAVEGEDPRSVNALYDRMLAWAFKAGHAGAVFGAIGTIDLALWDIKAKAAGEPLWRLLGGRDRAVRGYASGLDAGLDDDQLHTLYSSFAQAGFTSAKLKGGRNVTDDLRRLAVVRDALGVDHPILALDANESWNTKQAVRYLAALEQSVDLAWIEEPLRRWDVEGLATVSRQVRAAVATGENLTGLDQYPPADQRPRRRLGPGRRRLGHQPLPPRRRPGGRTQSAGQPGRLLRSPRPCRRGSTQPCAHRGPGVYAARRGQCGLGH